MGNIRRKQPNAYADEPDDYSDKLICSRCYDKGINTELVPYIMVDGRPDNAFKRCPMCGDIIPKAQVKHVVKSGPLGMVNPYSLTDPKFAVVKEKRNVRQTGKIKYEKEEVPKLAGKRDMELEALLEHGILVNISDDYIPED
jgi:hypothetical protein